MSQFFVSGDDYLKLPHDPNKWIIKDLIMSGGLSNVFGAPKAGKSFATLGMAHAISTGQNDWLGFKIKQHGRVAYLQIDTPRVEWRDRFFLMKRRGMDVSNIFVCDQLMLPQFPYNALDPSQVKWLQQELRSIDPIVVFIDTLREAHGGEENDATVMRNVVNQLILAARPAAVVLLSHSRKMQVGGNAGGEDIINANRGSNYVAGKMDCIIQMVGNGKRATAMNYSGRGAGNGRIKVKHDEFTGLIMLDGVDNRYWQLLEMKVNEWRDANPKITINKMALQLEELLNADDNKSDSLKGYKRHRQITTDINTHLKDEAKDEDLFGEFAISADV